MKLDEIAIKSSSWTWNRLREARKHGIQIGEESLTDFTVLNLKKWGVGKISIDTFTRHDESLNGADWEWWFTGPSGKWLGMRVQAKVLNLASEKYEHLHYENKHASQVDLLINDAKKNGLIPLYCMYNNWDPQKYKANWNCQTHKPTVRHYGISILSPYKVKTFQSENEKSLSSVINSLKPMHCIFCCAGFCCAGFCGKELPDRALNWLSCPDLLSHTDGNMEYLQNSPPHYVKQILEGELEDDSIDVHDQRLKRVTVFKELSYE